MEYLTETATMFQNLNVSEIDNNSFYNLNTSGIYFNESYNKETEISLTSFSSKDEVIRLVQVVIRPIIVVLGTYGNAVSFYIMRRVSLKEVSTCFYMAMLAIADTCELNFLLHYFLKKIKYLQKNCLEIGHELLLPLTCICNKELTSHQ